MKATVSLLALLLAQNVYAAKAYDEEIDDFTGQRSYTSKPILSVGGGKITSQIFTNDSAKIRVKKVYFGIDFDHATLINNAELLAQSDPAQGYFALMVEVVGKRGNLIRDENSLMVKMDGELHRFSASANEFDVIGAGFQSSTLKVNTNLVYFVAPAFLEAMLEADEVEVRVSGSDSDPTMELEKKGRKRLREFLAEVP